jgi:hypothetical protein
MIGFVNRRLAAPALALALGAAAVGFGQPTPAQAHCDSVEGPVVAAARQSLETGDAAPALAYVPAAAEPELSGAFRSALAVRRMGGDAAALADRYFFETTVRLHRAGEGAPYTGLKETVPADPALEAAEAALQTGSLDGVQTELRASVEQGVAARFAAVRAARTRAAEERTVAAQRERAEAELLFEKYVVGVRQAAVGSAPDAEAAPAHAHGA